jgi:hypothetical protein
MCVGYDIGCHFQGINILISKSELIVSGKIVSRERPVHVPRIFFIVDLARMSSFLTDKV